MRPQRPLFYCLFALLALGVVAVVGFGATGGPSRVGIWLLLAWIVALSGVVGLLDRQLRRDDEQPKDG